MNYFPQLSANWETATLDQVCDIVMGQAPSGDTYNNVGKGIPLIAGAADFGAITPNVKKWTVAPTKLGNSGDIVVCVRATIGDLNKADDRYCYGRGVAGIRPRDKVESDFLWFWLSVCHKHLNSLGRGATFKQISKLDLAGLLMPLPPLPEQRRIVARIKECVERIEEIERLRTEAVPERVMLLRSFYSETYNALLRDHPAKKLGDLGTSNGGGTPSKSNTAFWKGEIPWISPKDMKKATLSDSALHISKEAVIGSAAKLIAAGSILFVVRGMILAHTLPVAINLVDAAINQDMKAITPGKDVLPEFLAAMMKGAEKQLLAKVEIAGHGTCRLQTEHWASLRIPVPTLDQQQEIMAKVSAFESLTEALCSDLRPFDSTLRDAILRKAFAGEL
jgi:type I restriction enzyme S subunit